jgi:hypothetical protein
MMKDFLSTYTAGFDLANSVKAISEAHLKSMMRQNAKTVLSYTKRLFSQ